MFPLNEFTMPLIQNCLVAFASTMKQVLDSGTFWNLTFILQTVGNHSIRLTTPNYIFQFSRPWNASCTQTPQEKEDIE